MVVVPVDAPIVTAVEDPKTEEDVNTSILFTLTVFPDAKYKSPLTVTFEENVDAPEEVNGPVKLGVAAFNEDKVPTEVKDEFTTVDPRVFAVNTSSPSILYV